MSHFIGDHEEASTVFPRTSGFNGGIQGQEIGLFVDVLDTADFFGLLAQLGGQVVNVAHELGHFADRTFGPGGGICTLGHLGIGRLASLPASSISSTIMSTLFRRSSK